MRQQIVKCRDCGHDNPADYRFCGMCGRAMAEPMPSFHSRIDEREDTYLPEFREDRGDHSEPPEPPSGTSISGPSFLGIGDQSSAPEFSYLLEDEPSRGPGRVLVALLIILGLAAAGWWQVHRHGGRQWLYAMLRNPKLLTQSGRSEDGVPADRMNRSKAALMESATNPNSSKETDLQVRDQTLVPKDGQPVETSKSDSKTAGTGKLDSTDSAATSPDHENAEKAVRKDSENESSASTNKESDGAEAAVRKQASEETGKKKASPRSGVEQATARESDALSSESSAANATEDSNVRVAEKYLYGQGVRQDCGRALSLLQPAAASSNPKARSLLGTMYATGHCVPRDLPSSYRWFALSLREQPNNVWVSRNLQSVWNQMSDSEKKMAMRMTR